MTCIISRFILNTTVEKLANDFRSLLDLVGGVLQTRHSKFTIFGSISIDYPRHHLTTWHSWVHGGGGPFLGYQEPVCILLLLHLWRICLTYGQSNLSTLWGNNTHAQDFIKKNTVYCKAIWYEYTAIGKLSKCFSRTEVCVISTSPSPVYFISSLPSTFPVFCSLIWYGQDY